MAARFGCPGALRCQVGLPRGSWAPSWTARAHLDAILSSNLASKCSPEGPRPLRTTLPCTRERKFSKLPFVLSKCSWAASWQLLGPAWAPFELHLEALARLLGSTWGPWGAFGRHLGASWAPLGLHLGLLGASWANLGPSGRQMGSKWTPIGLQLGANWAPRRLPSPTERLASSANVAV